MKKVSMVDFRRHAERIIAQVQKGQCIILTRYGKPVARLEPITETPVSDDPFYSLTDLAEAGDSLTNPQIAASLRISPHTARAHVSNVLSKLDATSRVEAVTEAQRRGLVHDALNATTAVADHS